MSPHIEHRLQELVARYTLSLKGCSHDYNCIIKFLNAHAEITELELQSMLLNGLQINPARALTLAREMKAKKGVN